MHYKDQIRQNEKDSNTNKTQNLSKEEMIEMMNKVREQHRQQKQER